jgi:ATPase subunit of ABC transporter with duplicated ATPase domains
MITGQEKPDSGNIKVGSAVKLSYVDQSRDALNPEKSTELISTEDTIMWQQAGELACFVAQFNFWCGSAEKS